MGFVLHGDDVHLDAEIVVGGDDQPDVRATVSRFAIDGAPRGRERAMQRRFNMSVPRAMVLGNASTRRERSERSSPVPK